MLAGNKIVVFWLSKNYADLISGERFFSHFSISVKLFAANLGFQEFVCVREYSNVIVFEINDYCDHFKIIGFANGNSNSKNN